VASRKLLPQREVLQDQFSQFSLAAKHQRKCTDDHDEHLQHSASRLDLARNSTRTGFGDGQLGVIAQDETSPAGRAPRMFPVSGTSTPQSNHDITADRFTFDAAQGPLPVWSPDTSRIM
jgi:hypothetical protein